MLRLLLVVLLLNVPMKITLQSQIESGYRLKKYDFSAFTRRRRQLAQTKGQSIANENIFNPSRSGSLICNLCLVVDEEFAKAFEMANEEEVVKTMNGIIDRVSWVFRNVDWNDDGYADNVGFAVSNLVYGWSPFPFEIFQDYETPKPSMELLGKFAEQDFHSCCLGIGFTNRPFNQNQVGVSFIASNTLLGGICDHRNPPAPLQSANVALISGRGLNGSQLSKNVLETVLLHELGHTFGVLKHDKDLTSSSAASESSGGSAECSGFLGDDYLPLDYMAEQVDPPRGRFIMWGQELQEARQLKENNLKFSPCSRKAVMEIMSSGLGRGICLTLDENIYCGNGIVEYPEECDCGNEISCALDRCCGQRGSSSPCQLYKDEEVETSECLPLNKPLNSKGRSGVSNDCRIRSDLCLMFFSLICSASHISMKYHGFI